MRDAGSRLERMAGIFWGPLGIGLPSGLGPNCLRSMALGTGLPGVRGNVHVGGSQGDCQIQSAIALFSDASTEGFNFCGEV